MKTVNGKLCKVCACNMSMGVIRRYKDGMYSVCCNSCPACTKYFKSKVEAITAWNDGKYV